MSRPNDDGWVVREPGGRAARDSQLRSEPDDWVAAGADGALIAWHHKPAPIDIADWV